MRRHFHPLRELPVLGHEVAQFHSGDAASRAEVLLREVPVLVPVVRDRFHQGLGVGLGDPQVVVPVKERLELVQRVDADLVLDRGVRFGIR